MKKQPRVGFSYVSLSTYQIYAPLNVHFAETGFNSGFKLPSSHQEREDTMN